VVSPCFPLPYPGCRALPLLAVGIDSFDTPIAGCTTHFASIVAILLHNSGFTLADYPWLVRLNPAVPWKTRGNGAVALLVRVEGWSDARRALEIVDTAAKDYAGAARAGKETIVAVLVEDADSLQDYLRLRSSCLTSLYRRAVTELAPRLAAEKCLHHLRSRGQLVYTFGQEHVGLIGALAALGASLDEDYTFELLTYRKPGNWLRERRINPNTVVLFDLKYRPLTFENYDYETGRLLIAPHGLDPVLYGVRGETADIVYRALGEIEAGEEPSHWMIFRTNQATNAHLKRKKVGELRPYDNAVVTGTLEGLESIPGGHVVGRICDRSGCISVSFYRETGRLRIAALEHEGASVEVAGQVKPHRGRPTLNAEYLRDPCTGKLYTPPLSAYHHLMKPPERELYQGEKQLQPPKRLLIPETIEID
jgi:tRNA(Ile2)-agmatinylcytidine synthase